MIGVIVLNQQHHNICPVELIRAQLRARAQHKCVAALLDVTLAEGSLHMTVGGAWFAQIELQQHAGPHLPLSSQLVC